MGLLWARHTWLGGLGFVGKILTPICSPSMILPLFWPYFLGIEVEGHLSTLKSDDILPLKKTMMPPTI
jgi:hypothetical protein